MTKGSGAHDDPIVLDEDEDEEESRDEQPRLKVTNSNTPHYIESVSENGQVKFVELEDDSGSTTETASTHSCFGSRANSLQNESVKKGSAQSFIDPISTVSNTAKSGHIDTEAITSRSTGSPRKDATSIPSPKANPQSKQFHAAPEPSPQPDPIIRSRERSVGAPEPTTPPNISRRPSVDASLQPSALSRKRPYRQVEDDSSPRRSHRTRVETQKVLAAGGKAALFKSLREKGLGLGHAFPRHCREWEIEDLEDVSKAKDGTIWCTVRWKPTVVRSTTLFGEAAQQRLEELLKEKYGAEEWDKHSSGRRRRGKERNAQ